MLATGESGAPFPRERFVNVIAQQNGNDTSPDAPPAEGAEGVARPGLLSRSLYATGYYLSYSVTYPTLLVVSVLHTNNAACRGLHDGAVAAKQTNQRVQAQVSAATSAVAHKVGDTYASVAQKVQERVESVQDTVAERRLNRRLAKA